MQPTEQRPLNTDVTFKVTISIQKVGAKLLNPRATFESQYETIDNGNDSNNYCCSAKPCVPVCGILGTDMAVTPNHRQNHSMKLPACCGHGEGMMAHLHHQKPAVRCARHCPVGIRLGQHHLRGNRLSSLKRHHGPSTLRPPGLLRTEGQKSISIKCRVSYKRYRCSILKCCLVRTYGLRGC